MPVRFAFLTDTHHYPDAPVASKLMARAVVLGVRAMMLVSRRLRRSQRQQGKGGACAAVCGFAGISGGARSVRLRYLLRFLCWNPSG